MIGDELQRAQYAALVAANICGGRIYDKPPALASRTFPDVTLGDEQTSDDGNSCEDGWEVFTDTHVWSRPTTGSKAEAKSIVAQIVPVIVQPLTVSGFRVLSARLESTRTFWDPDGLTVHGVISTRYLIDPE